MYHFTLRDIKSLAVNSSGDLTTENSVDVATIDFEVNEAGSINAKVNAADLDGKGEWLG